MKIIKQNLKHNEFTLKVENLDDLWYLSYIIEKGDLISAKTIRKLKIGGEDQRASKVIKKPFFLTIEVEKIEFHQYSNVLRVSGKITQGPDDVPLGSYHTINLEENFIFTIKKEHFLKYQKDKLKESTQNTGADILLCVHDREEAYFVLLKKYGYDILTHISGNVEKKDQKSETEDFYAYIKKLLVSYDERYNFDSIVLASPSFWKEYSYKRLDEEMQEKVILASCSSVSQTGINELMKRDEVRRALQKNRFAQEMVLVEKLLEEISTSQKSVYGLDETKTAVEAGAVSDLLVTDKLIHKKRQDDSFSQIEKLMRKTEDMGGAVHVISSEHDGGQKLDGLGGIGGLLRYRLNYST